jgi:predicted Zn-dependent protease
MGGFAQFIISNAENLKTLQYSRNLEKEADISALNLMKTHNINPNGALHLFENLKKAGGTGPSEFLSTHPLFETRTKYIRESIDKKAVYILPSILSEQWQKINSQKGNIFR